MCTWFYAERSTLSPIITKAQQLPLANTIRNTMSRSAEMSGNIRPTDMAAVFAPNKQGNMAKKALMNMVMEKAVDYQPDFMQI